MHISIERTLTGFLVLSTVYQGYLVTRKYQGYTVREAKAMFRAELKGD